MTPKLHVLVIAVAALVASPAPMVLGAESSLQGTYTAKGLNHDGSEYHGIVKIAARGESFLVAWIFPERVDEAVVLVPKSAGVGIASGGTLAVSFYGQQVTGIILYQIEDGGARLVGRWVTADGDGAVRSETLTKMPSPSAPPATPAPGVQQPAPSTKPTRPALPRTVVAAR